MLTYPLWKSGFINVKSFEFNLDSLDEHIDFGDIFGFERTDPFSFSVWFKTTNLSDQTLLSKKSSTDSNPGYLIELRSSGKLQFFIVSSGTSQIDIQSNITVLNDGNWHNAIATYDGSSTAAGTKLYADGLLEAITVNEDTLTTSILNTRVLKLAVKGTSSGDFKGNMDEVSIWDRELSSADVTKIYNNGKPNDLTKLGILPPVLWVRLGDDLLDDATGGTGVIKDQIGANDGTPINTEADDIVLDAP